MPLPSHALTTGRLLCWLCGSCWADSGSGPSNWCLMPLQGPLACCSSTVLTSCRVICSHQCAAAAPAALPTSCQLPVVTQLLLLLLNVDSAGSAWQKRSVVGSRQKATWGQKNNPEDGRGLSVVLEEAEVRGSRHTLSAMTTSSGSWPSARPLHVEKLVVTGAVGTAAVLVCKSMADTIPAQLPCSCCQ